MLLFGHMLELLEILVKCSIIQLPIPPLTPSLFPCGAYLCQDLSFSWTIPHSLQLPLELLDKSGLLKFQVSLVTYVPMVLI